MLERLLREGRAKPGEWGVMMAFGPGLTLVTVVYAANGDILSIAVVALSGQNPNLSGQPDCGVIAPYLAGA